MHRVIKQTPFRSAIVIAALLLTAGVVSAAVVVTPSDDDMIISARAIVRGKVLSVGSSYDQQQDRIYTYIEIKVQEVLKGGIVERKIVLKELGGTVGDHTTLIDANPRFTPGEKVLLYLDTWADGSLRTHQMFLGKFNIEMDLTTGRQMVVRSWPDDNTAVLESRPHPDHPSGGIATEKMELSAYINMVRARLAVNEERSTSFQAQYYSDVPLLAVPEEFNRLSSGGLEPQFALLGPFRFFEPDSGQPVHFNINGTPGSGSVPVISVDLADVAAACAAWSNIAGCALTTVSDGTVTDCYVSTGMPGINFVFNNCDGRNSPSSGCSGLLAWGGISGLGAGSKIIGGTSFRQTTQGFVSFNPWAGCYFVNKCNLREVATHEAGHALGLNHPSDTDATMYAFAHFDGRCASIRQDDINGIKFIYPGPGGGSSPSIVTASLPGGTVGTSYSQTLTATGGVGSYTWAVMTGGSLPTGLSLTSGGVISGTPSAAATFNFTVQVTDSASATAQKALSIVTVTAPKPPPSITSPTLFDATKGTAFSGQLTVSGGTQPFIWAITSGSLPSGLNLNASTGMISGTPNAIGNFAFTVQVTDADSAKDQRNLAINVSAPALVFPDPGSPGAEVGTPFSLQLSATGGVPPYTWAVTGGALPSGVTLNASSGLISGSPTTGGNFNVTVQVTDAQPRSVSRQLLIAVANPPLRVASSSLPVAVMGSAYAQNLSGAGGAPPYTWSVTSGALPAGLSLNASTGAITGAPTVSGRFAFTVSVRDQAGSTAAKALELLVIGPEDIPAITKAKLKGGDKLVVNGANFDKAGVLLIDGTPTPAKIKSGKIIVEPLSLSAGDHQVRFVSSLGISSNQVVFNVN